MDFLLETLGKVGFDWRMGLFNLINFLIIVWILNRFLFKPMVKVINERQEKSTLTMENFEKAKTELDMAKRKAQDIVDQSKVDGNKIVERAHDQATKLAGDMREKAKEEIEKLIAQAKRNIELDRKDMQDALRAETVGLITLALEKITSEKLDAKKDAKYIQEMIDSLNK